MNNSFETLKKRGLLFELRLCAIVQWVDWMRVDFFIVTLRWASLVIGDYTASINANINANRKLETANCYSIPSHVRGLMSPLYRFLRCCSAPRVRRWLINKYRYGTTLLEPFVTYVPRLSFRRLREVSVIAQFTDCLVIRGRKIHQESSTFLLITSCNDIMLNF